jgi:hypothetical protein
MSAVVVVTGLIGGGIWGGLALAAPSNAAPTPTADVPAVAGDSVTTVAPAPTTATPPATPPTTSITAPAPTTTTTTTTTQPQPAIGGPAGCRYTDTCAPSSATTSP